MFTQSMSFALGEEIEAIRDTVQRFAAEEISPRAAEIDQSNEFPSDLWEKLGGLGLLGITADPAYGGSGGKGGLGYLAHTVVVEELARAIGFGCAELRGAFQFMCEPDRPQRESGAKGASPAGSMPGNFGRGTGDVGVGVRVGCGIDVAAGQQAQ